MSDELRGLPAGGVEVYRVDKHEDYNMNHKEDWIRAIETGKKPCMDIEGPDFYFSQARGGGHPHHARRAQQGEGGGGCV